ncbi:MAG: lysine 2,3-aminomutase [Coxiella sp. (in: Bacteria)]|nr:MAG: lysine 2,3-aminomutase [Coxiella sp. (in: g-proteobacteria)]
MSKKIIYYTDRNFLTIPQLAILDEETKRSIHVIAQVLPFRVNNYVLDSLIDWNNIPEDPIFQLTFPQRGMLEEAYYTEIYDLLYPEASPKEELKKAIFRIRSALNPHPSGQQQLNVPQLDDKPVDGIQHKYRETILFFPAKGQVCHSYCTFCFRWAQFVGDKDLMFKSSDRDQLKQYLINNQQVTDVIFTGGDPMLMKTSAIKPYFELLLDPELDHIQNIRIGTKALTYWPYRFTEDEDAAALLDLFRQLIHRGKHVAFMAHFNHYSEVMAPETQTASAKVLETGAVIRTQAPVLKHINNDPRVWETMWREQTRLGMVPYYMFVERDTGAKNYFEIPLIDAFAIYRGAITKLSGLSRTVRGPVMSATPGKVEILGVDTVSDEKVFLARLIQSRDPNDSYKPFYIKYDDQATWWEQLKPAFGADKFFFE